MWGSVSEGKMGENQGKDGKLNYQVRVMVIWMEKFKSMGAGALDNVERLRGYAEERMILPDMLNVGMIKGVNQQTSKAPVKVISLDIRTLGNGDGDRRGMVGPVRHTLGRRDSC